MLVIAGPMSRKAGVRCLCRTVTKANTASRYRYNSTTSSPDHAPARGPAKVSPYRYVGIQQFKKSFAPLKTAGWGIAPLPSSLPVLRYEEGKLVEDADDMQGRQLVREFGFKSGTEGWDALRAFADVAMEAIKDQDHHPTICICPAADYPSSMPNTRSVGRFSPSAGYIFHIGTHTHTPLPLLNSSATSDVEETPRDNTGDALPTVSYQGVDKRSEVRKKVMQPGVTRKDLNLAEKLEELYTPTQLQQLAHEAREM